MRKESAPPPEVYGIRFRAERIGNDDTHALRLYIEGIEEPIFVVEYSRDTTLMEMAYRTINSFLRNREFQPLVGILNTNQLILLSTASKELNSSFFERSFSFLPLSLSGNVLEFIITNDQSILRESNVSTKAIGSRETEQNLEKRKPVMEAQLEQAAREVLFQSATRVEVDLSSCVKLGLIIRSEPNRTFFFPDETFHYYYRFSFNGEEYWGIIGLDDECRVVALDQRMPHDKEIRMTPGN